MALITAEDLKKLYEPFAVDIGNGKEVLVKRPDWRQLLYEGRMPMPLLSDVSKQITEWVGQNLNDGKPREHGPETIEIINRLVAASLVSPRGALDELESGPDTILVSSLPMTVRESILIAVLTKDVTARKEESSAAGRFHQNRSGPRATPDVPGVLATAKHGPRHRGRRAGA